MKIHRCKKEIRNLLSRWKLRKKYKGYIIDNETFSLVENNKHRFLDRSYKTLKKLEDKSFDELSFENLLEVWESELEGETKKFATINNFKVIFAPLPDFNAMCTNKCFGKLLKDTFLIILNEALIYGLAPLSISLILLDLVDSEPDFVKYCESKKINIKQLPFLYFKVALNHFIFPREDILYYGAFKGINNEWDEFITNRASNITSKMLHFIIWHECGHIANKDLNIVHFYEKILEGENLSSLNIMKNHEKEYKADKYALDIYLKSVDGHVKTDVNAKWIYFSYVYYLFTFLEVAEKKKHILNYTHPPAQERKKHLFNLMNLKYNGQKFDLLIRLIDKSLNNYGGKFLESSDI